MRGVHHLAERRVHSLLEGGRAKNRRRFVSGSAVEGRDHSREELTWLWHTTTLEDEYIILRNSAGVNSHFYEPGPLHPEFEQIGIKFIAWYLDTLAGGEPTRNELAERRVVRR